MLLWKHNWHPPLHRWFMYMDYQQMCGSLNMVLVPNSMYTLQSMQCTRIKYQVLGHEKVLIVGGGNQIVSSFKVVDMVTAMIANSSSVFQRATNVEHGTRIGDSRPGNISQFMQHAHWLLHAQSSGYITYPWDFLLIRGHVSSRDLSYSLQDGIYVKPTDIIYVSATKIAELATGTLAQVGP